MQSLQDFPPEILAEILGGSHRSFLAIELWKCGSRVLSAKLASCITTVDLRDESLFSTSRWTRCLSAFSKLRRLSISCNGHLAPGSFQITSEIWTLPPTLQELTIHSWGPLFSFNEAESANPHGPPPPLNPYIPNPLPNLHRLSIHRLTPHFIESSFYASVRPSLRTLSFKKSVKKRAELLSVIWPPNMEVLDGSIAFQDGIPDQKAIDRLPSSLRRVREIKIAAFEEEVLSMLPRGLEVEILVLSDWNYPISQCIQPLQVEGIELEWFENDTFKAAGLTWTACLPSNLKSLISQREHTNLAAFLHLPASLMKLHAVVTNDVSFEGEETPLSRLENLVSLTISRQAGINLTHPLPKSITKFSTVMAEETAALTPDKLSLLPANMTDLELRWFHPSVALLARDQMILPMRLQSLILDRWHENWLDLLPKNMTSLNIHALDTPANIDLHVDYFAYAPPSLTSLTIGRSIQDLTRTPLSSTSFASLPNLTSLRAYYFAKFDPNVLITLSKLKKLNSLLIGLNGLPPELARYIPSKATQLTIWTYITEDFAPYWPLLSQVPVSIQSSVKDRRNEAMARALQYPDPRVVIEMK